MHLADARVGAALQPLDGSRDHLPQGPMRRPAAWETMVIFRRPVISARPSETKLVGVKLPEPVAVIVPPIWLHII